MAGRRVRTREESMTTIERALADIQATLARLERRTESFFLVHSYFEIDAEDDVGSEDNGI
ncbi:hypothetical protein LINPERHAP2_LOCUS42336 [Linum perenne]